MRLLEFHTKLGLRFQLDGGGRKGPISQKLRQKLLDELVNVDLVAERRLTSRDTQHVFDQAVQPLRVLAHDSGQTLQHRIGAVLAHQLARVADRRQRITNLVRDRCRQPAHRRQFQLLRAILDVTHVLYEDDEFFDRARGGARKARPHP